MLEGGGVNFLVKGRIVDARFFFVLAGVAFLLPETVCGEYLGTACLLNGVALSTHVLAQGLHF